MFSFIISIVALLLGYAFYGRLVEKVFKPDSKRITPAYAKNDGVDYIPMPGWKVIMIQFLNIAGTGPIFGAIMGAKFGPSAYLWIVFGAIFAGGVHDYFTGMMSIRHGGASLPDLVGEHMGRHAERIMLVASLFLLLLVGTVFVYSPAIILGDIAGDGTAGSILTWTIVIFCYYILATLLPVDKIIGRIYPFFAFALLFMAFSLMVCLFIKWPSLPEIWDGLGNLGAQKGLTGLSSQPIFPCLFITIACGAISGFHATQSPIMARCLENEKNGRRVFYGSMITEGLVALVWAAVSSYFFFDGGAAEVGSDLSAAAPTVVTKVAGSWLGVLGGALAIIGVVAAPITSGDTAFRSARLIIADFFHIDQKPKKNRILLALPLFVLTIGLLWYNVSNEDGFNVIWRYFGWANQMLAGFTLWLASIYLVQKEKGFSYLITVIPACFVTSVCVTYFCVDKICLGMPVEWVPPIAFSSFIVEFVSFIQWKKHYMKKVR